MRRSNASFPFKPPYAKKCGEPKDGDLLGICPDCAERYKEMEHRLFVLEGRQKELEATWNEVVEDADSEDLSETLGSQDTQETIDCEQFEGKTIVPGKKYLKYSEK